MPRKTPERFIRKTRAAANPLMNLVGSKRYTKIGRLYCHHPTSYLNQFTFLEWSGVDYLPKDK